MTKAYRTVSTEALQVIAGIYPLDLALKECYLKAREPPDARSSAFKERVRNQLLAEWQERWNQTDVGRRVWQYIPDVRERLDLFEFRPNYYVTQFLIGHGQFNAFLHRIGKKESDFCAACGLYDDVRHAYRDCRRRGPISPELQLEIEAIFIAEPHRVLTLYAERLMEISKFILRNRREV